MDTKINLCDNCIRRESFPECMPDGIDIAFGDAPGRDNIIRCSNFILFSNGEKLETENN